jgi:hypothetical protein
VFMIQPYCTFVMYMYDGTIFLNLFLHFEFGVLESTVVMYVTTVLFKIKMVAYFF